MSRLTIPTAAMLVLGIAACDTPSAPAARSTTTTHQPVMAAARGGHDIRLINMKDACDPETFAEIGCLRTGGGVTLDHFLAKLGKKGVVGAWHFAPPKVNARVGQTLRAVNGGGEVHTFGSIVVRTANSKIGTASSMSACTAGSPPACRSSHGSLPVGSTATKDCETHFWSSAKARMAAF